MEDLDDIILESIFWKQFTLERGDVMNEQPKVRPTVFDVVKFKIPEIFDVFVSNHEIIALVLNDNHDNNIYTILTKDGYIIQDIPEKRLSFVRHVDPTPLLAEYDPEDVAFSSEEESEDPHAGSGAVEWCGGKYALHSDQYGNLCISRVDTVADEPPQGSCLRQYRRLFRNESESLWIRAD